MVAYTYNPMIWEVKEEEVQGVLGQYGLYELLSQNKQTKPFIYPQIPTSNIYVQSSGSSSDGEPWLLTALIGANHQQNIPQV